MDLTERIAVNGKPVSRDSLVEYLNELYPAMKSAADHPDRPNPTFFEILTAMAFIHFSREKTDFSVMEVGLGGRLDSTNVILPLVAVITNIGKDHTKVLGERLEDIAREKAGIIKEGVPIITAEPAGTPAFGVIESTAGEKNAPLLTVDENMAIENLRVRKDPPRGLSFSLVSGKREYPEIFLPVYGRHQARNAAAAVLALEVLEEGGHLTLSPSMVKETLSRFTLHGRTQVLSEKPAFILDGAHNPLAMQKMRETLEESFDFEKMVVVFAAAADKDLKGIMEVLLPITDVIIFSRTNSPRTAKWEHFEALRQESPALWEGVEALDEPDFKKAVQRALSLAGEKDLVVATGSFYLVGDILAWKKGSAW
jgi:dihydrofolate synthase/folylpolyglutamate synthase